MRLVCISDTHNYHKSVDLPDGDVLIHAGDATGRGRIDEVREFGEWFADQPHGIKIFVPGNHDWLFERDEEAARELMRGTYVLIDEHMWIYNYLFYGSPWQPEFCNWAFNLPRGVPLRKKWDLIPQGTDILITHGPAWGLRDQVGGRATDPDEHLGCEELRHALGEVTPRVHIFGHIHDGYGEHEAILGTHEITTLLVNASICTELYNPTNPPIVVDL